MRLPNIVRLRLVALAISICSGPAHTTENPLLGVWITKDAYPASAPKGMAFRPDFTGVAFEAPYQGLFEEGEGPQEDEASQAILRQMLFEMGFPVDGTATFNFDYVLDGNQVTLTMKEMGGIEISSDPIEMMMEPFGRRVRLESTNESGMFLLLELLTKE